MAYQRYQMMVFGTANAGLPTVGYQLFDAAGSAPGSRIATGITDLGSGDYGAFVTIPDSFQGRITWDTGVASPVKGSEPINPDGLDQRYLIAQFGQSKNALATVGYRLFDGAEVAQGTRITAGVQNLGGGDYGALVTVLNSFEGRITWDTGEGTPQYASQSLSRQPVPPSYSARQLAAIAAGTGIAGHRGETWTIPLANLGAIPADRTKLVWTAKRTRYDSDDDAILQIVEGTGLVLLNGAAATAGNGSLTVTSQTLGDVRIVLQPAAAAMLTPGSYSWDLQLISPTVGVLTRAEGDLEIVADVTRAIS